MKCHYTYTEDGMKVLIPYCWPVVLSGNMTDCICRQEETFNQFEKRIYNEKVKALQENANLNRIIKKITKKKVL